MLLGASGGASLAGAALVWALGSEGPWVGVAILAAAALSGFLSVGEARRVEPMDPKERRDTILGWGAIIGFIAVAACLFLPMPWGALAAVAVLGTTVFLLRRVPPLPEHTAR